MASSSRPLGRRIARILLGILAVVLLIPLGLWIYLRGSLAQQSGTVNVVGLSAQVTVERDALGIPTVRAQHQTDAAYTLGFVHAQDRFFEMDLLRRVAAGELAALFGASALPLDRRTRLHRFRARAKAALLANPAEDVALLRRYVQGVNDGLHALSSRPFEYALLRSDPVPWQLEDSLLVVWAMYFDLQGNLQPREIGRGYLREHTTKDQLDFLLPTASKWEAPLDAESIPDPVPPIPATAPTWLGRGGLGPVTLRETLRMSVGSNNWALAGSRTSDGRAVVQNDMHLGIRLPHIWYRAFLEYLDRDGKPIRIGGVTLPGAPAVVVGSNGHVAWGFTNSYGDYLDLIEVQRDPQNPQRLKTGADWENATVFPESILVKGGNPETLSVRETSLGPVVDVGTHVYVVHWIAHDPRAVNLGLLKMAEARTLAQAQAVGHRAGMPAQNMVAADREGHIGWTIAGPIPARHASPSASFPFSITESALGFAGVMAAEEYPRVIDPPSGQVWTANARQLGGPSYSLLGDGGADPGPRAQQIRDDLTALRKESGRVDERAVYQIALDDRAVYLATWRARALAVLDAESLSGNPQRAEFRRLLEQSWDGHASVDSVGYRLTRGFLSSLYTEFFGGIDQTLSALAPGCDFDTASSRWQIVLERLIDEKPPGWIPNGRKDYREVQLAAIDRVISQISKDGTPLAKATWGARNTARIEHPFAAVVPQLRRWLSAPSNPQPGDGDMPRVSGPSFGQSERMAVSPGHEQDGIFNMPGGQSGHPLSRYFLAGHSAWVRGEPTAFSPGQTTATLTFVPK
ncbi:MAG TPA: penicillin acylase family protein [Pseudomonadota bacterium]|nr:penicillin acylase family protein [Pseudomonadota bacterium]